MKRVIIVYFILLLMLENAYANSFNPALYQTMSASSYRNNYNRQVNYQTIPYWQAQSNFATRNRTYQHYSNYNNAVYRHNASVKFNRSYR